ncbi:S8 family peptidase [Paenimyroides ummariense]|nr:S8 family peptidase [Paenimyroides ummariense]
MRKKILLILVVIAGFNSYAQNRKGQFKLLNQEKHQLLVSFEVPEQAQEIIDYYYENNKEFKNFVDTNKLQIEVAFQWNDEHFNKLREDAIRYSESDEAVLVLKGLYVVNNDLPNNELYKLAEQLEGFSFVRYAELNSLTPIAPPSVDIPPTTPNYFQNQTYIQANPGVNMQYAWNQGVFGQGIRVRDVEYGMSVTHEELTDPKFSNQLPISSLVNLSWLDHGTATAGVVAAHNGTYGVTGMQHGISEFKVFPEYTTSGYDRLFAINSAISASVAGDVILYEMQTGGVNSTTNSPNYVPAEYVNSIWDATKAATTAGIHIVAAAGNGGQNLDSTAYSSYMNRGDSGALMVGAGSNNTTHSRLNFSTYGQRVNVQGWGMGVLTSGYGDYAMLANDPNQSYTMFSGTSSATPVVASCVIALLSRAKASNYDLSPTEIRTILTTTGIAQGGNTSTHIGPFPNMQAAFTFLDNYLLSTNKVDAIPMNVFPNPASNELFVTFPTDYSTNEISIYDAVGRQVYYQKNYISNSSINVSSFKSGMYILKMKSNNAEQSKKIVIK